jgi:putative oxidoreductase
MPRCFEVPAMPNPANDTTADLGLLMARVMLSIVFLWSGVDKTIHWSEGLDEIVSAGLPYPTLLLLGTVLVQIGGGLSVALGLFARLGALALAGFTIIATLMFHDFWAVADPVARQQQLTTFLEHIAILGGFTVLIFLGSGRLSLVPPGSKRLGFSAR